MGTIRYSKGVTINTGNFESIRIDIGLDEEPMGEETHAQAYNRIKDFVESRLIDDANEERAAAQAKDK